MSVEVPVRGTVLVIDDSVVAQKVVRTRLEGAGFRVVTLDSAMNVTEAVTEHRPDMVLMDLEMPTLDGDTATVGLLRTLSDAPPIVIHSSASEEERSRRARACGAIGALEKTRDDDKFLHDFEEIFARAR